MARIPDFRRSLAPGRVRTPSTTIQVPDRPGLGERVSSAAGQASKGLAALSEKFRESRVRQKLLETRNALKVEKSKILRDAQNTTEPDQIPNIIDSRFAEFREVQLQNVDDPEIEEAVNEIVEEERADAQSLGVRIAAQMTAEQEQQTIAQEVNSLISGQQINAELPQDEVVEQVGQTLDEIRNRVSMGEGTAFSADQVEAEVGRSQRRAVKDAYFDAVEQKPEVAAGLIERFGDEVGLTEIQQNRLSRQARESVTEVAARRGNRLINTLSQQVEQTLRQGEEELDLPFEQRQLAGTFEQIANRAEDLQARGGFLDGVDDEGDPRSALAREVFGPALEDAAARGREDLFELFRSMLPDDSASRELIRENQDMLSKTIEQQKLNENGINSANSAMKRGDFEQAGRMSLSLDELDELAGIQLEQENLDPADVFAGFAEAGYPLPRTLRNRFEQSLSRQNFQPEQAARILKSVQQVDRDRANQLAGSAPNPEYARTMLQAVENINLDRGLPADQLQANQQEFQRTVELFSATQPFDAVSTVPVLLKLARGDIKEDTLKQEGLLEAFPDGINVADALNGAAGTNIQDVRAPLRRKFQTNFVTEAMQLMRGRQTSSIPAVVEGARRAAAEKTMMDFQPVDIQGTTKLMRLPDNFLPLGEEATQAGLVSREQVVSDRVQQLQNAINEKLVEKRRVTSFYLGTREFIETTAGPDTIRTDLAFEAQGRLFVPQVSNGEFRRALQFSPLSGESEVISEGDDLFDDIKGMVSSGNRSSDLNQTSPFQYRQEYGDVSPVEFDPAIFQRMMKFAGSMAGVDPTDDEISDADLDRVESIYQQMAGQMGWPRAFPENEPQ